MICVCFLSFSGQKTLFFIIIRHWHVSCKEQNRMRRCKFTVGIIVAETARCVSDIRSTSLHYTSFPYFLQACFIIPRYAHGTRHIFSLLH